MKNESDKLAALAMLIMSVGLIILTRWQVRKRAFLMRSGKLLKKDKSPRLFQIESIFRYSFALFIGLFGIMILYLSSK